MNTISTWERENELTTTLEVLWAPENKIVTVITIFKKDKRNTIVDRSRIWLLDSERENKRF